jgi:hypothetical protein
MEPLPFAPRGDEKIGAVVFDVPTNNRKIRSKKRFCDYSGPLSVPLTGKDIAFPRDENSCCLARKRPFKMNHCSMFKQEARIVTKLTTVSAFVTASTSKDEAVFI